MSIPASATVALVGAGEYLPAIAAVDTLLLERVHDVPRVVVLPTAAAPDGVAVAERWTEMGVKHFSRLGAKTEAVMLLTREDAENAQFVEQIAAANFVYLSGGKPRYLLETLRGTAAWQAIADVLEAGGVLAGCSAGAMVLGSELIDFPQLWRTIPALGLVSGIIVIPHFDELPAMVLNSMNMGIGSPGQRNRRNATIVGIDGSTALVCAQTRWVVQGRGGVTVFSQGQKTRYHTGEEVPRPVQSALN
jgi:cyanophycinase